MLLFWYAVFSSFSDEAVEQIYQQNEEPFLAFMLDCVCYCKLLFIQRAKENFCSMRGLEIPDFNLVLNLLKISHMKKTKH